MAHQASERSQKYLEKYLGEMVVPLHNERFRELSQLAKRAPACAENSCPGGISEWRDVRYTTSWHIAANEWTVYLD